MYFLVVCVIFIAAFVLMMQHTREKNQKEYEAKISRLCYGVRITAANGMTGTVTEILDDTVKVDFSPDQSGSIVEISKEAVSNVMS